MIKNLEIVKFDFCFYTIKNYYVYIYNNEYISQLTDDMDDWLESHDEFDTFWININ